MKIVADVCSGLIARFLEGDSSEIVDNQFVFGVKRTFLIPKFNMLFWKKSIEK
jgi:hypothetical protein